MNQKNYHFAKKWSVEIELGGYTPVPNLLIQHQRDLRISNGELTVLIDLLMYKWSADNPYPSVPTLAKSNGMASESIRRHLRSLENKQLLKRIYRTSNSNEYDLSLLKVKLKALAQKSIPPLQNQLPSSPKPTRQYYSDLDTKENAVNKTHIRNSSLRGGKLVSLSEMFNEVQRKKNERK
ncbi:MAG: hypothetical protein ACXWLH_05290 [Candidatus Saccharimonadales bacterium]